MLEDTVGVEPKVLLQKQVQVSIILDLLGWQDIPFLTQTSLKTLLMESSLIAKTKTYL